MTGGGQLCSELYRLMFTIRNSVASRVVYQKCLTIRSKRETTVASHTTINSEMLSLYRVGLFIEVETEIDQ